MDHRDPPTSWRERLGEDTPRGRFVHCWLTGAHRRIFCLLGNDDNDWYIQLFLELLTHDDFCDDATDEGPEILEASRVFQEV